MLGAANEEGRDPALPRRCSTVRRDKGMAVDVEGQ